MVLYGTSSKHAEAGDGVKKPRIEVFKTTINSISHIAFCVVTQDPDLSEYDLVTHADSAGSKPVQAYLNSRSTSSPSMTRQPLHLGNNSVNPLILIGNGLRSLTRVQNIAEFSKRAVASLLLSNR